MTVGEAYRQGRNRLIKNKLDSAAFDTICLFKKVFGYGRQEIIVQEKEKCNTYKLEYFFHKIECRVKRIPLQYLLGEWDFLSLSLMVGKGVLVPREETELVVEVAEEMLKDCKNPRILDLCAGTGAIGLGFASKRKDSRVTCIEFYPEAFFYLKQNCIKNHFTKVETWRADVLKKNIRPFSQIDALLSNPPYIRTNELKNLQDEVKNEPREALDGRTDGLLFYRKIAKIWVPVLRSNGIIVLEIGEDQAKDVVNILTKAHITDLKVHIDFNGLDRVVSGRKE